MYPLRFVLGSGDESISLGILWWPWKIKRTINHIGYWEIVETSGKRSIVSLEDITLGDLEFGF